MTEQTTEQATAQINELKVRVFDLQEALQAERTSFGQFVGVLAELMDFDKEKASSLQNYVDEIAILTGKAERPAEIESPADDSAE